MGVVGLVCIFEISIGYLSGALSLLAGRVATESSQANAVLIANAGKTFYPVIAAFQLGVHTTIFIDALQRLFAVIPSNETALQENAPLALSAACLALFINIRFKLRELFPGIEVHALQCAQYFGNVKVLSD